MLNPYEVQKRARKANRIADAAEVEDLGAEDLMAMTKRQRQRFCQRHDVKPASDETWDMVCQFVTERQTSSGEGLADPRVLQGMVAIAVDIADLLARNDLDSDEVERMDERERRRASWMASGSYDDVTFGVANGMLRAREEHRAKQAGL